MVAFSAYPVGTRVPLSRVAEVFPPPSVIAPPLLSLLNPSLAIRSDCVLESRLVVLLSVM